MKMKVVLVKSCLDCPLSGFQETVDTEETGGEIFCESSKWDAPRRIGTFKEVVSDQVIPDWCPLQDFEEFFDDHKDMVKELEKERRRKSKKMRRKK